MTSCVELLEISYSSRCSRCRSTRLSQRRRVEISRQPLALQTLDEQINRRQELLRILHRRHGAAALDLDPARLARLHQRIHHDRVLVPRAARSRQNHRVYV